ncbi:MFS transporter [Oscillatoria sp. FACHB-1407]|uniref:Npt1/Npt2 family nucleotide transporter n=1 Tax=Oscillatoria sp. FACHB-1407 TaxID=2692847 RepID=UPI0016883935|nr:Npt1/Npt2 family nucleotide transporter [Oscillatoria sp. FACHB-1407]MBD2460466.1 MFS transporter [Oscillatoria sp. FACHB-1407]
MELNRWSTTGEGALGRRLLRWLNLRPEESERTFLMFAFYTATSMGLVWFEASTVALFLDRYNVEYWLPWIYVASAGTGSFLGFVYSRLQKILPLRWVIVIVALLMAFPILGFRIGLGWEDKAPLFAGIAAVGITVFLMRLWLEAVYVLHDLNTSITANQLFNIREIKRAYPLISSGILVADVLSGFSLQLLVRVVQNLSNVILLAFGLMLIGAGILLYLCQTYQQAFPDSPRRLQEQQPEFTNRRLQGPLRRYVLFLFGFFILAQVLFLLVDFQFLSQLQQQSGPEGTELSASQIAGFLGLFNGVLGICELLMQWLASSRVIERLGVFASAMLLPGAIAILGTLSTTLLLTGFGQAPLLFGSLVLLKFLDELLHYTLFASVGPVLFQPIPDTMRGGLQAVVRGIAEPLSTGATGLAILGLVWLSQQAGVQMQGRQDILLAIVILAMLWFACIWYLRTQYVGLLVLSAERGQLSVSDVDLRELKRAVVEALDQPGTEADKRSCIELLSHIDPKNLGEVLAPLLIKLPPSLQRQSLEEMMVYPNPAYLDQVRALMRQPLRPEVLAVALRYVWLTEENADIEELRHFLRPSEDPVVRGTAASILLRRGDGQQKAEATETLRRMLTHERERERVMGCRALGEAVYMQSLRLHIDRLLQDESLRVRCALLEAIAATHLEEYYPSLLKGLHYKSTREAAMQALVRLENEAIPMLVKLGEDVRKSELVRTTAWSTIGQIGTIEALDALVSYLMTSWGSMRRNILRILLHLPQEKGIDIVSDTLGRSGVESLINQELRCMGQIYASLIDFDPNQVSGMEAELLYRALLDMQADAIQRLFLLMRFLYPSSAIRAADFNLQSGSWENVGRGLEILDNTLDIPGKRAVLSILDRRSDQEKMESLSDYVVYTPMTPSQRLRQLLELRHFLSDWALACCFHVARQSRWSVTTEQAVFGLQHPTGFVREAVLGYLRIASPRVLRELLPMLKDDPDQLVAAQVKNLLAEPKLRSLRETHKGSPHPLPPKIIKSNGAVRFPNEPGFAPP